MDKTVEQVEQVDHNLAAAQWWNHYSYSTKNATKRDAALSAYLAGCARSDRLQSTSDLRAKAEGLVAQVTELQEALESERLKTDRLAVLARSAIYLIEDAEKDTNWGSPTFGRTPSEEVQAKYDEIMRGEESA